MPLGRRIDSPARRHQIYTVRITDRAALPAFKGSGDITSLSHADGYIEIPEDQSVVEEGTKSAMPTVEHVLQPQATSPTDWQWRRADLDLCAYTTKDLAAQCITSVAQRLTVASAAVGRATSKAGTLS